MNPETLIEPACWVLAALSGVALLLLSNPRSRLSRLLDRLDHPTDRKAHR